MNGLMKRPKKLKRQSNAYMKRFVCVNSKNMTTKWGTKQEANETTYT